jgi:NADPH:quinone reductase-like Zn-dependent oxidoreductase
MKAYQVSSGANIAGLRRAEVRAKELGPHDVRVAIHAVSLNYRDLMFARGEYIVSSKEPRIAACDGAGEVIEVGSKVQRFRKGDRVATIYFPKWIDGEATPHNTEGTLGAEDDGVLAEQLVINEEGLVTIPAHLDFVAAATLPCAATTAWNSLFVEGKLKAGGSVLLQGTGGVSIHALQLARAAGVQTIITSSSDAKLEKARKLGADATINYRTNPEWQEEVLRITGGRGVDVVLEIGGRDTLQRSLAAARMGGSVAVIGGLSGWSSETEFMPLVGGAKRLVGIFVGSRKMFEDLNRVVSAAKIHPVVDRTFNFDQAREAYEYLASGTHFGKVTIKVT